MSRKELARFGSRGRHLVRVYVERTSKGQEYARVRWTEPGRAGVRTYSLPNSVRARKEAVAYAEGVYERLTAKRAAEPPPITLRELWARFQASEFDHLREATRVNYRTQWRKWELFAGAHTLAGSVTPERLDEYRAALRKNGHAGRQIRHHLAMVRLVYRFGAMRDLVFAPKVLAYRFKASKDEVKHVMREFRSDESDRILEQWSPRDARQWRAWVLTTVLRYTGARQTAARSLEWRDVNLGAGTVEWRAETSKQGEAWTQPVPPQVTQALWVAYGWRTFDAYDGPYVFYGVQRSTRGAPVRVTGGSTRADREVTTTPRPWSYQSFAAMLDRACKAAGVERAKYQGAHAFRRGVAGDVAEQTGSVKDAALFIGDKSSRVVETHYVLARTSRREELAALVGGKRKEAT